MKTEYVVLIMVVILYTSVMSIISKILRQRDKKIKLMKYEIDIKYSTDPNIEARLDSIINSVFDEYRLLNLEFRNDEYIKESDEKKIIAEVSDSVVQRISPVLLTQLSTYFNRESIGEVIGVKIATRVMEYRISRNVQK